MTDAPYRMECCPHCGGVIGRDCWNVEECGEITRQMQQQGQHSERVAELEAALKRIAERSKHAENPRFTCEDSWGNYGDVFADGREQAEFECAEIARAALTSASPHTLEKETEL